MLLPVAIAAAGCEKENIWGSVEDPWGNNNSNSNSSNQQTLTYTGEGNGFSFANINAHEFLFVTKYAADLYRHHKDVWNKLIETGMKGDYSWKKSAGEHAGLYSLITGIPMPKEARGKGRKACRKEGSRKEACCQETRSKKAGRQKARSPQGKT